MNKKLDFQPIQATALNDVVYGVLREQILNHNFSPGQRLDLNELEDALQVSRTPLKNALTRLEMDGLVDIQPRRGTFVTIVSSEKLEEAYKIRSSFELYVALCIFKYLELEDYIYFDDLAEKMNQLVRQCDNDWSSILPQYLKLDQQLHEKLIQVGGPPRMFDLFQQMNVHTQLHNIVERYSSHELQALHFEHRQIFAAIQNKSPERLNAVLLNHLEASRLRAMKYAYSL